MFEGNKQGEGPFALNRATSEFVGGVLYVIGFAGLSTLAGLLPLLVIRSVTVTIVVIEFLALIVGGGAVFVGSLRRDGLSWAASLGIAFIIAALSTILIYVPLWFITAAERALL
jgi:hypothetical protein